MNKMFVTSLERGGEDYIHRKLRNLPESLPAKSISNHSNQTVLGSPHGIMLHRFFSFVHTFIHKQFMIIQCKIIFPPKKNDATQGINLP